MTSNSFSEQASGRARRHKVAAAVAGALVLGVGAMATLASWNDSEAVAATYSAGQFTASTAR